MTEPVLLIEKDDGTALVTLNRPASMNALSTELRNAIKKTFEDLRHDHAVHVVILTGAGRAFCAGLDLKELGDEKGAIHSIAEERKREANLCTPLNQLGKPVIGAINGPAITGGFEMALACDILVASTEAYFADTHARVGIIPGSGLSQKLSRLIGIYRAKEVSLTGNFVSATQALEWGLVNRLVPPEELLTTCRALAADILSCPQDMVQKYKKLIDDGFEMTLAQGLDLERKTNYEHFQTVKPTTISKRREQIVKRGRKQKG